MKKLKITNKLTQGCPHFTSKPDTLRIKTIKSAIALMILFASSGFLFADEVTEKKARIVIYNFQMLKHPPEEIKRGVKQKDYSYYSIILPETISKKLHDSDRFLINRGKRYLLNNLADSINTIRENYSDELNAAAKQSSSDYVITGQYEVKNEILYVRIFIYNALLNDLQEVTASETETGI